MKYVKRTQCQNVQELFLNNLGVSSLDEVTTWFRRYKEDSYDIKGIDTIELMIRQLPKDTPVIIAGDYDVDGVTSSAIMFLTLTWLGFKNVKIYIPNRFTDGFGLNEKAFALYDHGLIFTVDNGIAQVEAVAKAKQLGYKVIVTDHHEPSVDENGNAAIPGADVVIDPNAIPGQADFNGYCGAGIAFKIARRLLNNDTEKRQILLSLACLGTVCDVMELREENYVFVRNGLKCLKRRNTTTAGTYALVQAFNAADTLTAHDCGFLLGPAINAVSRMLGEATEAVDLLKFDGPYEKARISAIKLVEINNRRKEQTQIAYRELKEVIDKTSLKNQAPIVVYLPGISEGLVGILAGKVAEEYQVPAIILSDSSEKDVLKGSARSLNGYHMKDHLDLVSTLLLNYGGHKEAAGLTLLSSNLDEFRNALLGFNDYIRISSDNVIEYDLDLRPEDIKKTLEEMSMYEPYGEGNEAPVFRIESYKLKPNKYGKLKQLCGNDLQTVRLENTFANAIGFNMAKYSEEIDESTEVSLYGTLFWNNFNGKRSPQIEFIGVEKQTA